MKQVRDSQRSKFYEWARQFRGPLLPWHECQRIIQEAWSRYKGSVAMPYLADGRGTTTARGSPNRINLPRRTRYLPIVLEETVHAITPVQPYHGPEFLAVFIDLMSCFGGKERRELLRLARQAKLKVARSPVHEPLRLRLVSKAVKATQALTTLERDEVQRKLRKEKSNGRAGS